VQHLYFLDKISYVSFVKGVFPVPPTLIFPIHIIFNLNLFLNISCLNFLIKKRKKYIADIGSKIFDKKFFLSQNFGALKFLIIKYNHLDNL